MKMTNVRFALEQRLSDALSASLEGGTRRDVRIPAIPGKAVAVTGVRRAGKTTFLRQQLARRLEEGVPREALLLLGLEDDRLTGLGTDDLDWVLEEYFRRHPGLRGTGRVTLCLDEIQVVPGWERFVRRLLDTERMDLLVSGSSAKLLSREVATSLRGRGIEVLVHPFSFRESLRHTGDEPDRPWNAMDADSRSSLDARLRIYLEVGGFPEAQGLEPRDRSALLRGYVDVMTLRDVIERHAVSNPTALLWLQRHLLSNPASSFSISKLFGALKSQGIPVGKDTLHEYLDHLTDAFMIRTLWMHSASERQRMVNPRKVYPVDPGLIPLFERSGRGNRGHALETVVLLELERRSWTVEYLRTPEGEVDFFATRPGSSPLVVQVAADTGSPETLARELRGLQEGLAAHPRAEGLLLTLDHAPPRTALPRRATWASASSWLLEED